MNRALLASTFHLWVVTAATLLLVSACKSTKEAQAEAPPPSDSGWYSEKVNPSKGTKATARKTRDEIRAEDEKRVADKLAAREARRAERRKAREVETERVLGSAPKPREKNPVVEPKDPEPQASPTVTTVLKTAKSYLNTPYRFGGTSRHGIDCSGLMLVSFGEAGVKLPRTSSEQAKQGKSVPKEKVEPGDVLFFATGAPGRVSHAGLVVSSRAGRIQFIHASTSSGVRIDELSNPYWAPRYLSARRLLD